MVNRDTLCSDLTQIIAVALDRHEHGWEVSHQTVAAFKEAEERPYFRYRHEPRFRTRVEMVVAEAMAAVDRAADEVSDVD
jgi:hypothetical protein